MNSFLNLFFDKIQSKIKFRGNIFTGDKEKKYRIKIWFIYS